MGVLIEGDPRRKKDRLYTMGEISEATGIKKATLHQRRKSLGIPASGAYPYAVVLQLIRRPVLRKAGSPDNVNRLRKQLQDNGMI